MIPLITSKLNLHTEHLQIIRVKVADSVFSGKKYFLRRLPPGNPRIQIISATLVDAKREVANC